MTARNLSTGEFHQIALFLLNLDGTLLTNGQYLSGRVILSHFTPSSTDVTLRFIDLHCDDGTSFGCRIQYISTAGLEEKVQFMNLTIAVDLSVPNIVWNDKSLSEGDTVMFTCLGNVGKSPASYFWQILRNNGETFLYRNVSTETTFVEDLCSYNGISNLTIQVTDLDNDAVIRCSINKSSEVYHNETRALDVMYKVRKPSITVDPMDEEYLQGPGQILLACIGRGNPKPWYTWFKEGNMEEILSYSSTVNITEIKTYNSGIYICIASNYFSGIGYTESATFNLTIVKERTRATPTSTTNDRNNSTKEITKGVIHNYIYTDHSNYNEMRQEISS